MKSRSISLIWPVLIMAGATLWMVQVLGLLPGPASDLLSRAWPGLFIAVGLMLLLGRRVRFGNLISVIIGAALVGGIMTVAYSQGSSRPATGNVKKFTQGIVSDIGSVKLVLNVLNTDIEIKPGDGLTPAIDAEFNGSRDSTMTSDFQVDGDVGTLTLVETQASAIPSLEGLGRGKLTVSLPANVAVSDLTLTTKSGSITVGALPPDLVNSTIFTSGDLAIGVLPATLATLNVTTTGALSFDATASILKNMNVTATTVTATMPQQAGLGGNITATGDVTVTIPPTIAANIQLVGNAANSPDFNQGTYIMNIDKVLVSRQSSQPQMQIKIETQGRAIIR